MNIRTYRAGTMPEALALVRRELGGEAIILSTRQVPLRRRFPWQRARSEAEVVAGIAEQTESLRQSAEFGSRTTRGADPVARSEENSSTPAPRSAAGDRVAERIRRRLLETPATNAPSEQTSAADRAFADDAPRRSASPEEAPSPASASPQRNETVESLLAQLNASSIRLGQRDIPDDLFHFYTQLIDADVNDDDARDLVLRLKAECDDGRISDRSRLSSRLAELVEDQLHCCGPIKPGGTRPTVAALVGPTGVGKTTTIAKLAANFKLRERVSVGLVTVDTYRVAAVEQLRTYAEIIDLPMHVVTSPTEMRRAVRELTGVDLVLIDTAGRSPRDELRIQELHNLLAEADVDQVHLVMSLVSSMRSMETTAARFRAAGATSMLLTKLDEAPAPGVILSAARRIQLPISYLTTGQDVPDDIEAASASRLSRLIVGREELAKCGERL